MVTATSEKIATLQIFGRPCPRCQARNRQGLQCGKAAIRGKRVCRNHGGRSTGAKTEAGRQRISEANWIHGRRTAEGQLKATQDAARIREIADALHVLGALNSDKKFRGRWPKCYEPVQDLEGVERLVQKLVIREGE